MKTHILTGVAALLMAFAPFASAERPSTDELALRTGVTAWTSAWDSLVGNRSLGQLASLYRTDLVTTGLDTSMKSWTEYAVAARSYADGLKSFAAGAVEDLRVNFADGWGTTSFRLHPRTVLADGREELRDTNVRLTWVKTGGYWQIAQQHIVCTPVAPATIAASR
jgi:ketosteroid isomerase-like protein